jgi:hypothetical protein
MVTSTSEADTKRAIEARSRPCTTDFSGGQRNNSGNTDQSLAASSGMEATPAVTWMPCVAAYSHTGRVGKSIQPGGSCRTWLKSPVTKQTANAMPSQRPSTTVSRLLRTRDENRWFTDSIRCCRRAVNLSIPPIKPPYRAARPTPDLTKGEQSAASLVHRGERGAGSRGERTTTWSPGEWSATHRRHSGGGGAGGSAGRCRLVDRHR